MIPEEAIKEMSGWKLDCRLAFNERHEKAIRLGIESLNRLVNLRDLHSNVTAYPRPTIRHAIAPLPSEGYIPEDVGKLPSDES